MVLGIDSRRVRFDLSGGKPLSLARDDPQLRHIDHAWSTTIHAAQAMTRDAAIGVLDTGHGRLTGQAGLYVEASRARDRFVLVTDNRETLEEALEDTDGARLTAREAVGETDLPAQPPDAAIRMLRDLRDDWRALVARAEAETTGLNRMEGYARIVTGVQALAPGLELPPEMQAFVDEVRQRDARIVEGRRDELAFVQKAEAHCHRQPLLKWAAEERGVAVSELPEHAAWLAEGAALEETGRRMRENPGFVARIAAALGRIAQGFRLDEGERFRDAAARHEAEAQRLGIDPGGMAGAARLVQRAGALGRHELPEAVRRTVEAWTPEPDPPAPERVHRPRPDHEEAGRRIEAFLRDCRHCLDAAAPAAETLDSRIDAAEVLRREGLRLLGEGEGAKLDDPARIRLSRAADERERVREAVDALGAEVQGLRSRAFVELSRSVARQGLEAHPDPVDLPAWGALRDRAEALRGEAGLAPDAREAVDAVLARDARVEAEIAPVRAFLEEGALHLDRRAALDEGVRGLDPPSPDAIQDWRERSQGLRETALNLLGESPADTRETQASARLADMPRLQGRVRKVLDRLETLELRDEVAEFRMLAATVERRARRQETLPLYAAGYRQTTAMAQTLASRAALPEAAGHEAAEWLDRDRGWKEELASALKLTEAQERDVDRASLSEALPEALREAARLPAVRAAIGQEAARLDRSPAPERGMAWTGAAPLVAGDYIAWRASGMEYHAAVAFPGDTGGMRASDTLLLRIAGPADGTALDDAGRIVEIGAQALWDGGCARAAWSDEGLRQLEAARQYSVPSAACRLACSELVQGDRIAWTEAAGRTGEVRTIEAVVATRTETLDGHEIALRVIRAFGPGAPEPGGSIRRTAAEVTARGCFRAPWSNEARRERVLNPPKEVQEQTLTPRHGRSHGGGGIGM